MMIKLSSRAVLKAAVAAACCGLAWQSSAQNTLTNSLIAFWPMNSITGSTTPDVVGGYNFTLSGSSGKLPVLVAASIAKNPSVTNCFLFNTTNNQSLFYLGQATDLLPINKNIAFTVNFWVNANATNNPNNVYVFAEDNDANGGIFPASSNPLWVAGMDSGGFTATTDPYMRFLLRDSSGIGDGGIAEAPAITVAQGNNSTTNAVFDGNWHMVTLEEDTNFDYFVFVDGQLDNGQGIANYLGQPAALSSRPGTNTLTGGPWSWDVDCTSIGALSRSTPGANGINGMVSQVSMWTRTLETNEVGSLFSNGLASVMLPPPPPKISTFSIDYSEVAQGTKATLRWNTANAADLTISPIVGDVVADTAFGIGSVSVTVTANTIFTLSASAPGKSTAKSSVAVTVLPGVAANWNLLQRFDDVATDNIDTGTGISADAWSSISGSFNGALGLYNVVAEGAQPNTNNVLGFNAVTQSNVAPASTLEGSLCGLSLNSESIVLGHSNTLFFRFYIADSNLDVSDIYYHMGLTWHGGLRIPGDFGNGNGPELEFSRTSQGIVDLAAPNGVPGFNEGLTAIPYSASVTNTGLATATVYDAWIDVQVNPFDFPTNADGTTNELGTTYSVYIKADASALPPTLVFSNYYSDADYLSTLFVNTVYGAADTNLVELFFAVDGTQIANPGTNTIVVDDFYMSTTGYNHTVPVPASFFPPPYQLTVNKGQSIYLKSDTNNNNLPDFTVAWNSSVANYPNLTYSVFRSTNLAAKPTALVTGYPSGGPSGVPALLTTFVDSNPPPTAAYYWVTSP
ncbi:MAG TPA: hypothetical protein VGO59_12395 [Verrucomicrobiae bacterium]